MGTNGTQDRPRRRSSKSTTPQGAGGSYVTRGSSRQQETSSKDAASRRSSAKSRAQHSAQTPSRTRPAKGQGSYRSSGAYSADGKYSRSQYVGANRNLEHYTRPHSEKSPRRRRRDRMTAIVVAIIVVAIMIGIGSYYYMRPIDIVVNGRSVEVSYNTTYEDLHKYGYLEESYGDLVAVDGQVLTLGGGNIYKIYDNGQAVQDYSKRVNSHSVVTEERGDDQVEEYEVSTETRAWTTEYDCGDELNFYSGSLHFYVTEGSDGTYVTHTGKISGVTVEAVEEEIAMVPRRFIDATYEPSDGSKVIALTFDDGPAEEYTQAVLSKLQSYGVKATFFELGTQAEEYPELSKMVSDAGMQVASHSYQHDSEYYLNKLDDSALQYQLSSAQTALFNATGKTVTVVRPPGGNVSLQNIKAAGDLLTAAVGWDIDTEDWQRPGASVIADTVLSQAFSGAVVLMHDGGGDRSQTVEALDTIIPQLQAQGYTFVTIDELIELEREKYLADQQAAQEAQAQADAGTQTAEE